MIALDTNVLLRLLVNDDPEQAQQAQTVVDRATRLGEDVLLPDVVLCEVEWVLSSTFGLSRASIVQTLTRLVRGPEFTFANRAVVSEALHNYERGKAEFSDYLVGAAATAAGATTTFTFDRDLRDSDAFTLLQG